MVLPGVAYGNRRPMAFPPLAAWLRLLLSRIRLLVNWLDRSREQAASLGGHQRAPHHQEAPPSVLCTQCCMLVCACARACAASRRRAPLPLKGTGHCVREAPLARDAKPVLTGMSTAPTAA